MIWTIVSSRSASVMAVVALCAGGFLPCRAQDPPAAAWILRVVDHLSGDPLSGVLVAFPERSVSRLTNEAGLVAAEGVSGSVRVVATRIGYADLDTLVAVPADGVVVDVPMERSVISVAPLTVQASREMTSRRLHRLMFDREVVIGAVGITRDEIAAVPSVAEPDVFRSVQSSAGVTSVNDFSGELYVRGGDSDQVSVLYDGAPVFGPYHLFGLFGTFNTDAVEYVEFYKGSFPARYGGSLSGVMSARPRTGGVGGIRASGGLSLAGLRLAADGELPWGGVRWIAAGRKASVDVARVGLPYSFHDFNAGLEAFPSEEHRIRYSLLTSWDHYAWAYDSDEATTLDATWANVVSSLTWSWVRDSRFTSNVNAYHSYYRGTQALGASDQAPTTTNRISVLGLRADATSRGERLGWRAGLGIEGGPVDLRGSREGALLDGDASRSYLHGSAFAEAELWLGTVRLAPGFRAGFEQKSSRGFIEPRFSARYRGSRFAVSASLDQTYQFLSVLRDALNFAPGAPMWFVREKGAPMTIARGASLSVDTWHGEEWTASVTGWARRFQSVPHWRPLAARDLSVLAFHDGSARGVDVMLQRHSGRIRGWIAYQWAWTGLHDSDNADYNPQWDRRHELDATMVAEWGPLTASVRGTIGTGTPFWMPVGRYFGKFFDPKVTYNPISQVVRVGGWTSDADIFTVWSDVQARVPLYARIDASIRYAFERESWSIVPYVSVVNVANRRNVIGYRGLATERTLIDNPQLPLLPFLGIDFRFERR